MSDTNLIVSSGRLKADPEVKKSKDGKAYIIFTIANQGRNEEVIWWNCVAFTHTAKFLSQYAKQGDKILIQGEVKENSYTDKSGQQRTAKSINVYKAEILQKKGQSQEDKVKNAFNGESVSSPEFLF